MKFFTENEISAAFDIYRKHFDEPDEVQEAIDEINARLGDWVSKFTEDPMMRIVDAIEWQAFKAGIIFAIVGTIGYEER